MQGRKATLDTERPLLLSVSQAIPYLEQLLRVRMVGKNRYLFLLIIKFLDQALKAKCFISKIYRHGNLKDTLMKKPTSLLRAGEKTGTCFTNLRIWG